MVLPLFRFIPRAQDLPGTFEASKVDLEHRDRDLEDWLDRLRLAAPTGVGLSTVSYSAGTNILTFTWTDASTTAIDLSDLQDTATLVVSGTKTTILGYRTGATLIPGARYIVTDWTQGARLAGTNKVMLTALDTNTLSMSADVITSYHAATDSAWRGLYDIDRSAGTEMIQLADSRHNLVCGATSIGAFDWGNTHLTFCTINSGTWTQAIGTTVDYTDVEVSLGATLVTSSKTAGAVDVLKVSENAYCNVSTSGVINNCELTTNSTVNLSGTARLDDSHFGFGCSVTLSKGTVEKTQWFQGSIFQYGSGSIDMLNVQCANDGQTAIMTTGGSSGNITLDGCVLGGTNFIYTEAAGAIGLYSTMIAHLDLEMYTGCGRDVTISNAIVNRFSYYGTGSAGGITQFNYGVLTGGADVQDTKTSTGTVTFSNLLTDGGSVVLSATAAGTVATGAKLHQGATVYIAGTGLSVTGGDVYGTINHTAGTHTISNSTIHGTATLTAGAITLSGFQQDGGNATLTVNHTSSSAASITDVRNTGSISMTQTAAAVAIRRADITGSISTSGSAAVTIGGNGDEYLRLDGSITVSGTRPFRNYYTSNPKRPTHILGNVSVSSTGTGQVSLIESLIAGDVTVSSTGSGTVDIDRSYIGPGGAVTYTGTGSGVFRRSSVHDGSTLSVTANTPTCDKTRIGGGGTLTSDYNLTSCVFEQSGNFTTTGANTDKHMVLYNGTATLT